MVKKLKITPEHVKLIKNYQFKRLNDQYIGVDTYSPFGGTDALKDIAWLLNMTDKIIPESIEDPLGVRFDDETQDYLAGLGVDLYENMEHYMNIMFQFADKGGLVPGVYKCILPDPFWEYLGPLKEKKDGK